MRENKSGMSIQITNMDTVELIKADMKRRGIATKKAWMDRVIHQITMHSLYGYGDMVRDFVTGFTGMVTGFENYYDNLPNRYLVENEKDRRWICESRLVRWKESEDE